MTTAAGNIIKSLHLQIEVKKKAHLLNAAIKDESN